MKKTKLLMPLAGVAALGATVAPIVTLTSCGNNEYVNAADKSFIEGVNKSLKHYGNTMPTAYKALTTAKLLGYDLANWKLSNGESNFYWDAANQCFIVMHNEDVVAGPENYNKPSNTYDLWKFTDQYDKTSKYSQYLKDDYSLADEELVVSTGLDVGTNTGITKITYVGDEKNPKNVVLRTFCDTLTVHLAKDTVNHFEDANDIYVDGTVGASSYREVGKAAYIRIKNTKFVAGYFDEKDLCQVDVIESLGNVSGEQQKAGSGYVTVNVEGNIKNIEATYSPTITTISDIDDLVDINTSAFIRLSDNLSFAKKQYWQIEPLIQAAIILDLNGHTITDKDADYGSLADGNDWSTGRIFVGAAASLTIMDTSSDKSGHIDLYDHSIIVDGDEEDQAILYLNGAEINYYAYWNSYKDANNNTQSANRGAIYVGHTYTSEETEAATHKSRAFMYGGSVNAYNDTKHGPGGTKMDTNAIGFSCRGKESYLHIANGTIYCPETICISGNGSTWGSSSSSKGQGKYDGSYIDIINGTLIAGNDQPCIYQPQEGTLNITGGTLSGGCCVNQRDGDLRISGGNFIAYGEHKTDEELPLEKTSTESAITSDSDGSVIMMGATNSYGTNISVTITGATMYSMHSSIFRGLATSSYTGYIDVDFLNGNYIYNFNNDGYEITSSVSEHFRINKDKGNWLKI